MAVQNIGVRSCSSRIHGRHGIEIDPIVTQIFCFDSSNASGNG